MSTHAPGSGHVMSLPPFVCFLLALSLCRRCISLRRALSAFNEGLYDIHVRLNGYDFLEYKPSTKARAHTLLVHHVMTAAPLCVAEVVRAGDLLDMLRDNSHNGFPVIPCEDPVVHNEDVERRTSSATDSSSSSSSSSSLSNPLVASALRSPSGIHVADVARNFCGIVLRKHLCVALSRLDLQPEAGIHPPEVSDLGASAEADMDPNDPPMPYPYTRMPRPCATDINAFKDMEYMLNGAVFGNAPPASSQWLRRRVASGAMSGAGSAGMAARRTTIREVPTHAPDSTSEILTALQACIAA